MHEPRTVHKDSSVHNVRYLKSVLGEGILFAQNGNLKLETYTGADWERAIDDRKSTLDYCFFRTKS